MNWLKRSVFSICRNWWKNLLLVLLFTALFAVAVGSLTLYGTTKAQTDHLQKALGNAVTLKGVSFSFRGDGGGFRMVATHLQEDVVKAFVDSGSVEAYNFAEAQFLTFPEAEGVYQEYWKDVGAMSSMSPNYTVMGYAAVDTSLDQAFTVYGFQLEEGEHLSSGTMQEPVCLISRQFAERNGFAVGDSFQVQSATVPDAPLLSLKVLGIFTAPNSDTQKGSGWRPEDMIFFSPSAFYASARGEEKDMSFSGGSSQFVTVYLKSPDDVEAFVEEVQQKLPIRNVLQSHFDRLTKEPVPEEYAGMDGIEALSRLEADPQYDLVLDREWYGMVGKPLERVRDLAGVIAIVMLGAILLILSLASVLMLKGRKLEMGTLLAMGEKKSKVAGQQAVEAFLPLLFAMLLGLFLGVAAGSPLVENLCNGVYEQSAAISQGENDLVKHAHTAQNKFSLDVYRSSYAVELLDRVGERVTVYPKAKATLDRWSLTMYLLLTSGVSLLAVLVQAVSVLRLKPARILTGKG